MLAADSAAHPTYLKYEPLLQVPSMAGSYVKPGTEEECVKEGKLGIQVFPGPLKYPYMHTFLTTFAGMMG